MDKILANYEKSIYAIAKKVAGKNYGIIDDLAQIGRMVFVKLYPENQRWAFLSRAIKNKMLSYQSEMLSTVRIPEVSQRFYGIRPHTVEIPLTMPAQAAHNDYRHADMVKILAKLESDIEALRSKTDKAKAKRYLEDILEGKQGSKWGKRIVDGLMRSYKTEALNILEDV